jgi:arsenite methyltransferase
MPECSCSGPESIKERTRAKYDAQWRDQDERAAAERRKSLSSVADPLISMIQPLDGKVVVDLGIGTGSLAFRALELGRPERMIGLDFSGMGLCVSRGIASGSRFKDSDVELVRADLEQIPLANRSVDIILSQATINLLPNKSVAMREISRIAKTGARIAISDAFRSTRPGANESWEQCIAGAVTVGEFSTLALTSGLIVANQVDLTQQVRSLVKAKKWDWPEFVEHNMDYRGFLLLR